jgi:general secretion pathway protein J
MRALHTARNAPGAHDRMAAAPSTSSEPAPDSIRRRTGDSRSAPTAISNPVRGEPVEPRVAITSILKCALCQGGFTLIELLIALALFGIMSLLAWRGLDTVLQSRGAVEAPGRAALQLAAAWTQLETDLHAARATGTVTPAATPASTPAPHIAANTQQLALLRAPAHCAGCWEGVVYDVAQHDGEAVLRRRTTALHTDAAAAQAELDALARQPATAGGHVLLRGAGGMRLSAWRVAAEGVGAWVTLGAAAENVFPAGAAQRQSGVKSALKVEWQLAAPWDGWVSKVVLLENRW